MYIEFIVLAYLRMASGGIEKHTWASAASRAQDLLNGHVQYIRLLLCLSETHSMTIFRKRLAERHLLFVKSYVCLPRPRMSYIDTHKRFHP